MRLSDLYITQEQNLYRIFLPTGLEGKGSPATEQSVCRALDGFADDLQAVVKNMAYQWQEYAAKVNRHLFCVGRQLSVRRLLPFGLLRHFAAIRPMNGDNLRHYHVLPKCGYQR